ncbi:hypothetical protein B0H19DRAFT_1241304 [Mycena capillaripes]|nr:hypothetical protein B0H19DRAFT_1241304 [Mycena capillaripes]
MRGAALRTLKWDLSETEPLGILLTPGYYFPNLKELSVSGASDEDQTSYDYLRIPGLEKLECCWTFSDKYETWCRLWSALYKALDILPSTSPLLHALKFRIVLYGQDYAHYHERDRDPTSPPYAAYGELLEQINQMRFSALVSLDFSVHVAGFRHRRHPRTNIGPLLLGHPSVTDVVVDVTEMRMPWNLCSAHLPRLRSFAGSAEQCAAIAADAQQLERLYIVFERGTSQGSEVRMFTPDRFPPNLSLVVRRLAVARTHGAADFGGELSPTELNCLVRAFPNVAHLNVHLEETSKISEYRDAFVTLHELEYLRLYRSIYIRYPHKNKPPIVIFPADEYTAKINGTLRPFLPRLAEVHMFLLGRRGVLDGDLEDLGCPCCDPDLHLTAYNVEYRFSRDPGAAELMLLEQRVSGDEDDGSGSDEDAA